MREMENYSTMSRDKAFRKRAYVTIFLITFGIIALYGLVFSAENFFGGTSPGGVSGSSYATIETGTRAWSELLEVNGYGVTRDRGRVTLPSISPNRQTYKNGQGDLRLNRTTDTLVVLDGALPFDEANEVREFINKGGRLITDNPYVLEDMLGSRLQVDYRGSKKLFPSDESVSGLEDISKITASQYGSLKMRANRDQRILLESKGYVAGAAIFRLGQGDVIAIPNSPIVSNELITQEDNALFSLRIAGNTQSSVTFIEGVHGYNEANGFAGMPLNWRIAIVGLFVAFVIFATSKGRRFGVGEQTDRNLGPRRIYFAHALAQALKRTKR